MDDKMIDNKIKKMIDNINFRYFDFYGENIPPGLKEVLYYFAYEIIKEIHG